MLEYEQLQRNLLRKEQGISFFKEGIKLLEEGIDAYERLIIFDNYYKQKYKQKIEEYNYSIRQFQEAILKYEKEIKNLKNKKKEITLRTEQVLDENRDYLSFLVVLFENESVDDFVYTKYPQVKEIIEILENKLFRIQQLDRVTVKSLNQLQWNRTQRKLKGEQGKRQKKKKLNT